MHLICPPKFCISIVLNGMAVIHRRNEKNIGYAKLWPKGGQIRCNMGDAQMASGVSPGVLGQFTSVS